MFNVCLLVILANVLAVNLMPYFEIKTTCLAFACFLFLVDVPKVVKVSSEKKNLIPQHCLHLEKN